MYSSRMESEENKLDGRWLKINNVWVPVSVCREDKALRCYRMIRRWNDDDNSNTEDSNWQIAKLGTESWTVSFAEESTHLFRMNAKVTADITELEHLHEPGILENITVRSLRDRPYTFMGNMLISINPLKAVKEPIEIIGSEQALHEPHPFAIAEGAYQRMRYSGDMKEVASAKDFDSSQSIVVSGESGAGKSESCKRIIWHLVSRSCAEDSNIDSLLLEVNPIFEAFGNSCTHSNFNSSRFGKFTRLHFQGQTKQLVGASMQTFLLEQSRLSRHGHGERNFHIFYAMLHGLDNNRMARYGLHLPSKFWILLPNQRRESHPTKPSQSRTFKRRFSSSNPIDEAKSESFGSRHVTGSPKALPSPNNRKSSSSAAHATQDHREGDRSDEHMRSKKQFLLDLCEERDSSLFASLTKAFDMLEMSDEDISSTFSLLAGILHLGNVKLKENGNDACSVVHEDIPAMKRTRTFVLRRRSRSSSQHSPEIQHRKVLGNLNPNNWGFPSDESGSGSECKTRSFSKQQESDDGLPVPPSAQPTSYNPLHWTCKLFGLDEDVLETFLCERIVNVPGVESVVTPRKYAEAIAMKNTIAETLYVALFDSFVARINDLLHIEDESLTPSRGVEFIGVLDIFGFENFETNGFEQLLINFTNEALNSTFCEHVFANEWNMFLSEGLVLGDGDINKEELERRHRGYSAMNLLLGSLKAPGLMKEIDNMSRVPKADDSKMLHHLHKTFQKNALLFPRPNPIDINSVFIVQHYAGRVQYTVGDFIKKNIGSRPGEIVQLFLSNSHNDHITRLFNRANQDRTNNQRRQSVIHRHRDNMSSLIKVLDSTSCSFIRCIKPNWTMRRSDSPNWLQHDYIVKQLRYLGVVQSAKVISLGFPNRISYCKLLMSYSHILPELHWRRSCMNADSPAPRLPCGKQVTPSIKFMVKALFKAFGVPPSQYKLGQTKAFFRSGELETINAIMKNANSQEALQVFKRSYIKMFWRRCFIAVTCLNAFASALDHSRNRIHAACLLQRVWRARIGRRVFMIRKTLVRHIQRLARGHIGRCRARKIFETRREKQRVAEQKAREQREFEEREKAVEQARQTIKERARQLAECRANDEACTAFRQQRRRSMEEIKQLYHEEEEMRIEADGDGDSLAQSSKILAKLKLIKKKRCQSLPDELHLRNDGCETSPPSISPRNHEKPTHGDQVNPKPKIGEATAQDSFITAANGLVQAEAGTNQKEEKQHEPSTIYAPQSEESEDEDDSEYDSDEAIYDDANMFIRIPPQFRSEIDFTSDDDLDSQESFSDDSDFQGTNEIGNNKQEGSGWYSMLFASDSSLH